MGGIVGWTNLSESSFLFASEIKAISAHPLIYAKVNSEGMIIT